jgi:hypothetical protein
MFFASVFAIPAPDAVSEVVSGVPKAVLSNRTVAGTTRREDGTPARSSRPAIEGRRSDIVCCAPLEFAVKCWS